jgi:fermentation-respiration switch protein FrsA (DUF1100 family)
MDTQAVAAPTNKPACLRCRIFRRLGVFVAVIYVMWLGVLSSCEEKLLFPRDIAGPATSEATIPPQIERMWITGQDGSRVEGWFIPAAGASAASPAPAAIFFHGNAELIDHQQSLAERYHDRGISILLAELRGYGRSQGSPSQRTLTEDAVTFYDWLAARPEVDKSKIIIHGRSIGTGVAAQLAALRPPAALILESPFISIASFAWRFGVPPFFVRNSFHTDEVLPKLTCPILILHGRSDEIIPIEHGQKLHELAPASTFVELDGSHNSGLSEQDEYWKAVDRLLANLR